MLLNALSLQISFIVYVILFYILSLLIHFYCYHSYDDNIVIKKINMHFHYKDFFSEMRYFNVL